MLEETNDLDLPSDSSLSTQRDHRPLPTRRPTEREIINDFPPRRQPSRERGLASFPRGATKRERIALLSASHGERRSRFFCEPQREGLSPASRGTTEEERIAFSERKVERFREKERMNQNKP